jgi:hypothetical protein
MEKRVIEKYCYSSKLQTHHRKMSKKKLEQKIEKAWKLIVGKDITIEESENNDKKITLKTKKTQIPVVAMLVNNELWNHPRC